MKQILFIAAALVFSIATASAQQSEVCKVGGKAIGGYDPVAFFREGKPVMGADSLSFMYKEAKWLFSSAANRDAFKADPARYAPQFGGYCAYGTAEGHKAPGAVETWSIVDGKLYFMYNSKVKEMWMKDESGLINKANKQWPMLKDKQ